MYIVIVLEAKEILSPHGAVISPVVVVVEDGSVPQDIHQATVAKENAQIIIMTGKGGNRIH